MKYEMQPVGIVHSPYKEKFAVPRQPGLAQSLEAELELIPPFNQVDFVRGLEEFSHVWLTFVFHHNLGRNWHPTVRPPRLGGNRRVGVFASRSPFRPNPLGLSAVELAEIRYDRTGPVLVLRGTDLVDGTPILDIKPYLPYSDAIEGATGAFAEARPEPIEVRFSEQAEADLGSLQADYPHLRQAVCEILALDPRPAYRGAEDERSYGVRLFDLDLKWEMDGETARVLTISPLGK